MKLHRAYDPKQVGHPCKIKVRLPGYMLNVNTPDDQGLHLIETTVGRALLSELLPSGLPFSYVNKTMNKKAISNLINMCYRQSRLKRNGYFC